jgi:hypothetical protein
MNGELIEPGQDTGQDDGGENLDTLAREAASLDGQPEQVAAAEIQKVSEALAASNAGELLAALMMARGLALPILPKIKGGLLREVWTDDVLENIAQAGGQVLALHGQGVGNLLGQYAPYIVLIGALVRPVLETREILSRPEPKPINSINPVHTENSHG